MTIAGGAPEQQAAAPRFIFDPSHPNLTALTWKPTQAEATDTLRHLLYGDKYDNVRMAHVSLPLTWPRWASVLGIALSAGIAVLSVPSFLFLGDFGVYVGVALIVAAVIVGGLFAIARAIIHYFDRIAEGGWLWVKLLRLGQDNGFEFVHRAPPPVLPGCIFTTDTSNPYVYNEFSTYIANPVTPAQPQNVLFGNYIPFADESDGPFAKVTPAPERSWGFLAVELNRKLPNLLLVSRTRQPGDMFLPIAPDEGQVLSLEGDFDKYFTLYCPAQFEQDALYVLTPDLMALLIDKATPFDVEIAGDWMFFYSRIPFDMLDPTLYQRLFDILLTIGGKVTRHTALYSDGSDERTTRYRVNRLRFARRFSVHVTPKSLFVIFVLAGVALPTIFFLVILAIGTSQ